MPGLDFKAAVEQEEARLRLLHPTASDIPGCVSVFDDYISCSGKIRLCPNTLFQIFISLCNSNPVSSQVHLQVWTSDELRP